ncbi:MAG: hypothetical protein ABIH40_02940 [Candidatus Omnitrophota bacterium]
MNLPLFERMSILAKAAGTELLKTLGVKKLTLSEKSGRFISGLTTILVGVEYFIATRGWQ